MKYRAKYLLLLLFILIVIAAMFFIYANIGRQFEEKTVYYEANPNLVDRINCFFHRGDIQEYSDCVETTCQEVKYYCVYKEVK